MEKNSTDFFNTVKKAGQLYTNFNPESKYVNEIKEWNDMDAWQNAYNTANELEKKSSDKTFLFSAQHKDCIILATILTALYQSNSNKIIWRPQVFTDEKINKKDEREYDQNAINMSASLSLLDWNKNESANSFLHLGSKSSVSTNACDKIFKDYIPKYLLDIKDKYYTSLKSRYLCMYEFNDDQLNRYVRLSEAFGTFIKNKSNMKQKIKEIKKLYVTKCRIADTVCEDYLYNQDIQSRILTTTPKSKDPYITYILEPNDDTTYSDMKAEIIAAIQAKDLYNRSLIGGRKKSKRIRKQSKRKHSKRKQSKRRLL
jgi:hypothetical protein